jgi:cytochrome c553
MLHSTVRVLKYFAAAGGCAALAVCTVYVTRSEAQGGREGQPQSGTVANPSKAVPIFGITIQPGYRDWRLISVAHEAGSLNDIRAILGNDAAINAYRAGKLPFPDGTIIARLSWNYVPSEENDKVFGRPQSFVAGSAPVWYLQFMVKDSKKYAATRGWGYAQFDKDGNPADAAKLETCAPCHEPAKASDYVFTHYAP